MFEIAYQRSLQIFKKNKAYLILKEIVTQFLNKNYNL